MATVVDVQRGRAMIKVCSVGFMVCENSKTEDTVPWYKRRESLFPEAEDRHEGTLSVRRIRYSIIGHRRTCTVLLVVQFNRKENLWLLLDL